MKPLRTSTLKWITTGLLVTSLGLMLFSPWVIRRPKSMKAKSYLSRLALFGGVLGMAAVGAGVCAFAILKREQEFYREKAKENLQSLIEATREDHLRKQVEPFDKRAGDD